jgi:hypothetical protein
MCSKAIKLPNCFLVVSRTRPFNVVVSYWLFIIGNSLVSIRCLGLILTSNNELLITVNP